MFESLNRIIAKEDKELLDLEDPVEELMLELAQEKDRYPSLIERFGLKAIATAIHNVRSKPYTPYTQIGPVYTDKETGQPEHLLQEFGEMKNVSFDNLQKLAKVLFALNPRPEYEESSRLIKFTEDTSALVVGEAHGKCFKIYRQNIHGDDDISLRLAKREAYVLRKMQEVSAIFSRVTKLASSIDPDLEHPEPTIEDKIRSLEIPEQDLQAFRQNLQHGIISFNGWHILLTESEQMINLHTPEQIQREPAYASLFDVKRQMEDIDRYEESTSRLSEKYPQPRSEYDDISFDIRKNIFMEIEKRIEIPYFAADIACMSIVTLRERLYTLAQLHTTFTEHLTGEDKAIIGAPKYQDFVLLDPGLPGSLSLEAGEKLGSKVLEGYISASERQRAVHASRRTEGKLVFTHGDAKWDNWVGYTLIDFGSCKMSTEYKDVAKSLLDCAHILERQAVQRYINHLRTAEASDNWLVGLAKVDPSVAVADGKVTPELGRLLEDLQQDGDFHKFKQAYADQLTAKILDYGVINDYIDLYIEMREVIGNPICETRESFRRNVYDAIITESVRTIHYKAPIPEKRRVVDHMTEVAGHYVWLVEEMDRRDMI